MDCAREPRYQMPSTIFPVAISRVRLLLESQQEGDGPNLGRATVWQPGDIAKSNGKMKRELASMATFLTLQGPTGLMRSEEKMAGSYRHTR